MNQKCGWISVKDRLPEDNEVYVVFNGEIALLATYRGDGKWMWIVDSYVLRDVTHWIPLPGEE